MEEKKKSRKLKSSIPYSIVASMSILLSMEENSTKINAIPTEQPLHNPMASHSLMSTIVTLYTLILLYFPTTIAFSPVLISTSLLLLSLLKLGAAQRAKKPESKDPSLQVSRDFAYHDDCTSCANDSVFDTDSKPDLDPDPIRFHDDYFSNCEKDSVFDPEPKPDRDSDCFGESTMDAVCGNDSAYDPEPKPFCGDSFVEWNVRAPLEVIYEAYEEEEEECTEEKREEELRVIERYASLSMYYPETDTDSSSDGDSPVIGNWDSPEKLCFQWDEEEDREELIEIELDFCKRNSEVEEENLIEIDLTPANLPVGLFCN
ncbi:uncharacterized protein [Nicotiana tomentosiformis]|uniref:uncharacterized protein n=1 Tax=Nicotiana tomentosiformis TaxID=4098 RepID=UPI00051AD1E8|nr:uncharacterized protein LOC104098058 [Nicotiana tomentosiformis]